MSKRGTCWVGYEQKGMKKKGNKMVPNCVPAGMKKGGLKDWFAQKWVDIGSCLLYTSPSPRDGLLSRMPSSA